ncbi:MAG: hypothetical protein AW09_000700 [Candidatus Accumulibacter phosphatis]|uniref:Uncharacterized protein n=1 Tax=Candidatus Accumulibacter phosphatis TaxID=327160 RepID=A0A080LYS9_9PROT|nr:MAG: hypothetical protein AW09_000700 [Candidatus Accumulibacter phosphatis]
MSSKVIGFRSSPGSSSRPLIVVPAIGVTLTVVKRDTNVPPAVPSPSASSAWPSLARMPSPTTWIVIVDAPGSGFFRNSQAKRPSAAGTIVAASLAPVVSVA